VATGRMFQFARGIIEVRVKLENPLWERVSGVNPNLLRTPNNGIIQDNVIIEMDVLFTWGE
jgi:hypothetical protein